MLFPIQVLIQQNIQYHVGILVQPFCCMGYLKKKLTMGQIASYLFLTGSKERLFQSGVQLGATGSRH